MDNNERKDKGFLTEEEEQRMRERMAENRQKREAQKQAELAKKEKRSKKNARLVLGAKIALVFVVVISLLFIAAQYLGNVTFPKAVDYMRQAVSNLKPGPGYPLSLGSGSVNDMQSLGDCVVLLKDDSVVMFNSTAKEIQNVPHNYSKPILTSANGRMLLCDRTNGRYKIFDRNDVLKIGEIGTEVYCCAIGKTGNSAFSVKSENNASTVSVFSKEHQKLFDFNCADEYIIGVSLSPNGKYVAAIGIGASSAYIYSKLYIIGVEEKKVVSEFRFEGKTLNNVFYSGKSTVIAIAENSYSIVTENTEKADSDFGINTISRFASYDSGSFSLVLTKYGSINEGTVALLDSMGKELFSQTLGASIECVDFDGSTVCVFDTDNYISCFNSTGKLTGKTKLDVDAQKIAVSGKYVYALCYGDVVRCNVKTDAELTTTAP